MSGQKSGGMHPQDIRNLIIFIVISVVIWGVFDKYVFGPQQAALQATRQQQTQISQQTIAETKAVSKDPQKDRAEVLASDAARIGIDNNEIAGSLSLTGARIDDISLKEYFKTLEKKENVELFSPVGSAHPYYAESGWVNSPDTSVSLPNRNTVWTVIGSSKLTSSTPVKLQWNNGQGLTFVKDISLDEHFMFTVTDSVINNSSQSVTLFPYAAIAQRGIPDNLEGKIIAHEGLIGYFNDDLEEIDFDDLEGAPAKIFLSKSGWTGFSRKYWMSAILPAQDTDKTFRFLATQEREPGTRPLYQADVTGQGLEIESGKTITSTNHFYVGAKKLELLDAYENKFGVRHFDLAIDFGVLYFMTRPFHWLLTTFFHLTGNFGIAIILLTILIRVAVFPLANTSYKSFAKLKKVAPEMKDLRTKFSGDKARLQKEMVKLYEKEKVNPMAGCLPILLQIPIFFAMYKVIYITLEMRHAPFFGWIHDLSKPDPTSIFNLFGLIPFDVPSFLMIGVWPCIMLIFMILQQKMNPPPQDPMQKTMMAYFPFFITFILSGFAAGLVVYWTVSNALSVLQQGVIMKRMGVPIHLFDRSKAEKELDEEIEKGPAVHPQAQMIEEDVEEALFGNDDNAKDKAPDKDK